MTVETQVTHTLGELADAVDAYGPLPFLCAVIRVLHGHLDINEAVQVDVVDAFIEHFPNVFSRKSNRSILEFYDCNPDRVKLPPTMYRKALLAYLISIHGREYEMEFTISEK